MSEQINQQRRSILSMAALGLAAAQLGSATSATAQPSTEAARAPGAARTAPPSLP